MVDDARFQRFERPLPGLHAAGLDALPGPLEAAHTAFVALIEFWRDDPGREGEVDAKLRTRDRD